MTYDWVIFIRERVLPDVESDGIDDADDEHVAGGADRDSAVIETSNEALRLSDDDFHRVQLSLDSDDLVCADKERVALPMDASDHDLDCVDRSEEGELESS